MTDLTPTIVRHQMCVSTLKVLADTPEEDIEPAEAISQVALVIASYFDEISEEVLDLYLSLSRFSVHDPLVDREVRDIVNMLHNADVLRIVDLKEESWIDPENPEGFHVLVNSEASAIIEGIRIQAHLLREAIANEVAEFIKNNR